VNDQCLILWSTVCLFRWISSVKDELLLWISMGELFTLTVKCFASFSTFATSFFRGIWGKSSVLPSVLDVDCGKIDFDCGDYIDSLSYILRFLWVPSPFIRKPNQIFQRILLNLRIWNLSRQEVRIWVSQEFEFRIECSKSARS
jgi:hypothetical protein